MVPFTAIKGFFDPAVQFGLQFETKLAPGDGAEEPPAPPRAEPKAEAAGAGGRVSGGTEKPSEGDAPKVVSLDQFRKK